MLPIRVLVVDDSVVVRKLLSEALSSTPEIQIAGTAPSGSIALAKIPQLNPDIVTLDIEMPGLDGIETLKQIRKTYPTLPVIMCSTLTDRGAAVTLEALSLGASDYITKPSNSESLAEAMEDVRRELVPKILSLVRRERPSVPRAPAPAPTSRRPGAQRIDILAIGSSTGGPNALMEVVPHLPQDFPVPVVVVQHMPPVFTGLLAERLKAQSRLPVREAEPVKKIEPGQVWIARGNHHLKVVRGLGGTGLVLTQDPPENSCRPAVDVLFRSVAEAYGAATLAVVLTGMGSDGARGAAHIREAGGEVFVQDEATSVVWGMPGAVVNAGMADKICPLADLAREIIRRVQFSRRQAAGA